MDLPTLFLITAGLAFILEWLDIRWGESRPKWWALGVALYIFSLAV